MYKRGDAQLWTKYNTDNKIANFLKRTLIPSNSIIEISINQANWQKKMKDFYSIRINDQWRIVFKRGDGNASEVIIMDYHK